MTLRLRMPICRRDPTVYNWGMDEHHDSAIAVAAILVLCGVA